jgi:hypothetical protein
MKFISYILITVTLVIILGGCKKAEELRYKEDPRVYFSKFIVNPDSVIYSFGVQPDSVVQTILPLTVRIMGSTSNQDRVVNINIDDSSTAKPGYHFTIGSMVIPANEFQATVPVTIYRRPGLKDSLLHIFFTIAESKDFKPGFDDIPGTLYKKTRLHYKISFNDYLLKPTRWDVSIAPYLGAWSEVKFRFVILVTGKTSWDAAIDSTPGIMNFVTTTAKNALRDYEAANGPLIDENGQQVTFP